MGSTAMYTRASRCPRKCHLDKGLHSRRELRHRSTMDKSHGGRCWMHMESVYVDDGSARKISDILCIIWKKVIFPYQFDILQLISARSWWIFLSADMGHITPIVGAIWHAGWGDRVVEDVAIDTGA